MFAINTKRFLLSVCAVALSTALVSAEDAYVRSFASSMQNDHVAYDGNKLVLYASPSALTTAILGIVSGIGLAGGAVAAVAAVESREDRLVFGLGAASLVALGGFVGYQFIDRLQKHLNKVPYFTFDNTGLYQYGALKFRWSDVAFVELETRVTQGTSYISPTTNGGGFFIPNNITNRVICFRDVYRNVVLTLSDADDFLSVSIDNLAALAEHYQKLYGKQQA